jgi:hypothetical protein
MTLPGMVNKRAAQGSGRNSADENETLGRHKMQKSNVSFEHAKK